MAEGSSASASTGHGGGGGFRDSGPPIPYRNAPLDYYPPVMCCCNLKSLKLISWSDGNTGRRYYRCKHVRMSRDCGFFRWIDPEYSDFLKTLLLDLRNAVRSLKREVSVEREASNELKALNATYEKELLEKEKQLNAKDASFELLAARKTAGSLNFSSIFFMFVVGILFGVSFSLLRIV